VNKITGTEGGLAG